MVNELCDLVTLTTDVLTFKSYACRVSLDLRLAANLNNLCSPTILSIATTVI